MCCKLTKDVVSAIAGLITSIPMISDWHCMRKLFSVMPPSTSSLERGMPQSAFIASRTSRTWKQTASSVARIKWPRCVSRVMPQMTLKEGKGHYSKVVVDQNWGLSIILINWERVFIRESYNLDLEGLMLALESSICALRAFLGLPTAYKSHFRAINVNHVTHKSTLLQNSSL